MNLYTHHLLFFPAGLNATQWWLGIIQQDVTQIGHERDYKWLTSDEDIPNTSDFWNHRYTTAPNHSEHCGYIISNRDRSGYYDRVCTRKNGAFICVW